MYIVSPQRNPKIDNMKLKLRKIGNSIGAIFPLNEIKCYNIGDIIEVNVITKGNKEDNVITKAEDKPKDVITPKIKFNTELCSKHLGSMKGTCGCK